tara:strand:- start:115 stop:906 length:792 start_codon:yes stop_codon:yes gene_type:complete
MNEFVKNKSDFLNPYKEGIRIIGSRLLWDFNLQSIISRNKLRKYKNKYKNKKAVILCNGPSLNKVDFKDLQNTFTFGLNKINLLFERSDFRPSVIVSCNPYVIEQNANFYNSTKIPLLLDSIALRKNYVKPRKNIIYYHSTSKGFARDCSLSIHQGYTVTYVALQFAFHFGFNQVALVGADHTFGTKGPSNKVVNASKVDNNHFDKRYFSGDMKWQLPDLLNSEVSYTLAKENYECFGRKVYNATVGGSLEIFERIDLKDFIS